MGRNNLSIRQDAITGNNEKVGYTFMFSAILADLIEDITSPQATCISRIFRLPRLH